MAGMKYLLAAVFIVLLGQDRPFAESFGEEDRDLVSTGTNPYFMLVPGYRLVLEGGHPGNTVEITITVLDETKKIAGVETRAVEEKEIVGGEIREVTRDYFAISRRTNNVYYFGEDVDVYSEGKPVSHEGAWLAGVHDARYGLAMPATPLPGARYYQEIAPGVAMDRAEIVSLTEAFECPAGNFDDVLRIRESTALDRDEQEYKHYARGVGLLQDGSLKLVQFGMTPK